MPRIFLAYSLVRGSLPLAFSSSNAKTLERSAGSRRRSSRTLSSKDLGCRAPIRGEVINNDHEGGD